jgi:hypothetical protein
MSYLATHLLENSVLLKYSSAHIKFVRQNLKISHHTQLYLLCYELKQNLLSIFMIYLHINFPIPVSSDSLVIAIKLIVCIVLQSIKDFLNKDLHIIKNLLPWYDIRTLD